MIGIREEKRAMKIKPEERRLFSVPIEMIGPPKNRLRAENSDITALTESVRRFGVLEPIMIRPDGKSFELVFGERRLRAAAAAGLRRIPAIITFEESREKIIEIGASENLHRLGLNMFEEGYICEMLEKIYSLTPEQIARRLVLNRSTVGARKRFSVLSRAEKRIIIDSALSARHVRALTRIKDTRLRIFALWQMCENEMNAKEAEEYVSGLFEGEGEKTVGVCKTAIKDIGIFANTIDRALALLEENGVDVICEKNEDEQSLSYTVVINKKK